MLPGPLTIEKTPGLTVNVLPTERRFWKSYRQPPEEPAMRLVQIARYPVKSLQGELVSNAEIERNGVHGDRCWGIRDEMTGKVLTSAA